MSSSNSKRWQSSLKTDREALFPLLKFTKCLCPRDLCACHSAASIHFCKLSFAVVVSTFITYRESTTISLCLLHPWEPCFQIHSSLQVPGGCEPLVFNSLPSRVCICLPSHPQCKALTKFFSLMGPMEKRWGRRANDACPHWWRKVCRDFRALQGVSTCLPHSPSASGFSKNMV